MSYSRQKKIVLAKPGLDGHNIGIHIVAQALRDAGFEVVYLGMMLTPEEIVNAAIQEDAGVIGLSILGGAHMSIVPRVLDLVREKRASCRVVLGGIAMPKEVDTLRLQGLDAFFGPGTPTAQIVAHFRSISLEVAKGQVSSA